MEEVQAAGPRQEPFPAAGGLKQVMELGRAELRDLQAAYDGVFRGGTKCPVLQGHMLPGWVRCVGGASTRVGVEVCCEDRPELPPP